jgi:hypothetical protein
MKKNGTLKQVFDIHKERFVSGAGIIFKQIFDVP